VLNDCIWAGRFSGVYPYRDFTHCMGFLDRSGVGTITRAPPRGWGFSVRGGASVASRISQIALEIRYSPVLGLSYPILTNFRQRVCFEVLFSFHVV
jgi:hypothetical protein